MACPCMHDPAGPQADRLKRIAKHALLAAAITLAGIPGTRTLYDSMSMRISLRALVPVHGILTQVLGQPHTGYAVTVRHVPQAPGKS